MQKSLSEFDKLQSLISEEYAKYKQANTDDKEFDEVKTIYIRIKGLQKEITKLTDSIHKKIEGKNSN